MTSLRGDDFISGALPPQIKGNARRNRSFAGLESRSNRHTLLDRHPPSRLFQFGPHGTVPDRFYRCRHCLFCRLEAEFTPARIPCGRLIPSSVPWGDSPSSSASLFCRGRDGTRFTAPIFGRSDKPPSVARTTRESSGSNPTRCGTAFRGSTRK